jgi:hypothetical protein
VTTQIYETPELRTTSPELTTTGQDATELTAATPNMTTRP